MQKILTLELIALHPYMCQKGSLEQAYMKVPEVSQILDFNFRKSYLDVSQERGGGGVLWKCQNDVIKNKIDL